MLWGGWGWGGYCPRTVHGLYACISSRTQACAKAGVNILCDKPLEITVARCDAMIAAARDANVLLGGIFQSRFHPNILALKQAVSDGRFGTYFTAG